jgi:peptide/nickel transport system ATP-binding protein
VNAPHSILSLGLEVSGLRVVYDGFVAVADTSFTVSPGESFGIVGESGSGKSTVLRAICGLAPRTAGTVKLLGQDSAPGSKAFRRQVQMVFQDPYGSLHPRHTVDRILAEPLAIHGIAMRKCASNARSKKSAWAPAFVFATRTSSRAGSASASRLRGR